MPDELLVKDFIKKAMSEIESGLGAEYAFDGAVDFELSVGITKTGQSGFSLKVLGVGAQGDIEDTNEIIHTIAFSVRSKKDLDHQIEQQFKVMLKEWLDAHGQQLLAMTKQKPTVMTIEVPDERIRAAILRKKPDIDESEIPILIGIVKEELARDGKLE